MSEMEATDMYNQRNKQLTDINNLSGSLLTTAIGYFAGGPAGVASGIVYAIGSYIYEYYTDYETVIAPEGIYYQVEFVYEYDIDSICGGGGIHKYIYGNAFVGSDTNNPLNTVIFK